mgnify:CR=1 FL=1
MPAEIALLLYVIAGAFVALLVFACREQIRGVFLALAGIELPAIVRRPLFGKRNNVSKMLEGTYGDLQKSLIEVRAGAAKSKRAIRKLEGMLSIARAKAEAKKSEAVDRPGADEVVVSIECKMKIRQLEEELEKQKEIDAAFSRRIADLESEVQKAYTHKQILISRDKAMQAQVEAYTQLRDVDTTSAGLLFEKIEQAVADKEASVAARLLTMRRQISPEKLRLLGRGELEQCKAGLIESIEALDSTILMVVSSEAAIERQIQKAAEQANTWERRAQMAEQQNNEGLASQARQRKRPYEQSVIELTENLAHLATCRSSIGESHVQLIEAIERIDARFAELDGGAQKDGGQEERKAGA